VMGPFLTTPLYALISLTSSSSFMATKSESVG
jgi:hypothetical protein